MALDCEDPDKDLHSERHWIYAVQGGAPGTGRNLLLTAGAHAHQVGLALTCSPGTVAIGQRGQEQTPSNMGPPSIRSGDAAAAIVQCGQRQPGLDSTPRDTPPLAVCLCTLG